MDVYERNTDHLETIIGKKVLLDQKWWYCSSQNAKEYFLCLSVQRIINTCIHINACCSHPSESKREDIYMPSPNVKNF